MYHYGWCRKCNEIDVHRMNIIIPVTEVQGTGKGQKGK